MDNQQETNIIRIFYINYNQDLQRLKVLQLNELKI
jgi:hypothetical protein